MGVGNVIECENGYVVVPSYTEAIIYDKDGKEITRFDWQEEGQGRRRDHPHRAVRRIRRPSRQLDCRDPQPEPQSS